VHTFFKQRADLTIALLGSITLVITVAGCRSLDPQEDILSARDQVAARTGVIANWPSVTIDQTLPLAPLDLHGAIQHALEVQPEIRAQLAKVARARADLVQAERLPNPKIVFGVGTPIDGGGGNPARIGILEPLTALWSRPKRIAEADAKLRTQVLDLADLGLRTAEKAELAFVDLHHATKRLNIDLTIVQYLNEHLALLQSLAQVGELDRLSVEKVRIELSQGMERAAASRSVLNTAKRKLDHLVGRINQLETSPPLDPSTLPNLLHPAPPDAELIELVALRRLDVAAALARAEATGARLQVVRRERVGAVGLAIGFERNLSDREALTIGGEVPIPIFDLGGARVAAADATREEAVQLAKSVLWNALLEVRIARAEWIGVREQLSIVTHQQLSASETRLRLVSEAAAVGESSRSEVLLAQVEADTARRAQNEAELKVRRAWAHLKRSAGGSFAPVSRSERSRLLPDQAPKVAGTPQQIDGGRR